MNYKAGTHIIATLECSQDALLSRYEPVKQCLDKLIAAHSLQKLGEVYHDFPTGGFTAVVCLSESHISVHTWPEYRLVNMDIYLSNHLRSNDGTVESIFNSLVGFLQASVHQKQTLVR